MIAPRLRQLVFASREPRDIARLKGVLGLGDEFVDPGVAEFGLTNGVFALGDQFLEVVVPIAPNSAAERFMTRSGGQGGYMAIFQTDDLDSVRKRADAASIRRVWNIDLPDISASHLHPADIGAAIVSIDEARPPNAWRWGGPDWSTRARPGAIRQLDVSAVAPEALAHRWANLLGIKAQGTRQDTWDLELDGGRVRIRPGPRDELSGYTLVHPNPEKCLMRAVGEGLEVIGARFHFAGVEVSLVAD